MRVAEPAVAGWEVAVRAARLPGVSMAGFRGGRVGPVDVRVVPHPAVTLMFEFGNGPRVVDVATGREEQGSLAAGFLHGAVRVRGENIECVQVRLSPVVARAVLGTSAAELEQIVVALDDVWGPEAERIRQRLGDAASWSERFVLVEELLAGRLGSAGAVDPEVVRSWDRLVAARGQTRIEDLAAEVGWSRKRLWSRFRSQLGLTPKGAARLVRFDHAAHRLAAGERVAQVAADSGYADQSHLHRDVLAFSGVTPATVVGEWLMVDGVAWAGA